MEIDYKAIGRRVKQARNRTGMTQQELSDAVNFSVPHISHIETGNTKPSLEAVISIANALNTTVDSLLYDNIIVTRHLYDKDIKDVLETCSFKQRQIIYETVLQLAKSMKD